MICLRDFRTGEPEDVRLTLCRAPAAKRPTASCCVEWWKQRAVLCPECWEAWQQLLDSVMVVESLGRRT
jgi:hypothetical protein